MNRLRIFGLMILGIVLSLLSGPDPAAASAPATFSCSTTFSGWAEVRVAPAIEGREYVLWRQGHVVPERDGSLDRIGGGRGFQDFEVLNRPVVHYSLQLATADGKLSPRVYCGSVRPPVATCSVSLIDGQPEVEWTTRDAEAVWRNGRPAFSRQLEFFLGDRSIRDTGVIPQVSHYSVQWPSGERSYCGMVQTEGAQFTCDLAVYYEGFPYIRIRPSFDLQTAPGTPVVYRDGKPARTTAYLDETNGRLDAYFTPNVEHRYEMGWINQQGQLLDLVADCGTIETSEIPGYWMNDWPFGEGYDL